MKQDRLVLLLWVGKDATSHSHGTERVLAPGIKVLQQLSNPDDNIHGKVFDFLLVEDRRLEGDHLKIISSLPKNDVEDENEQRDRRYLSKDLYPGF